MLPSVDWDIYQIAAGLPTPTVLLSAAVCAAIQICAPLALLYVNWQAEENLLDELLPGAGGGDQPEQAEARELLILAFLRTVFVLYNLILELRLLQDDDAMRLTLFLSALPEFSTCGLWIGVLLNLTARMAVAGCTVLVMLVTDDPVDIVLNSLALSFIGLVDNEAVMPEWIEELNAVQKAHRFKNKTYHVRLFQRVVTHASSRPALPPADEDIKPPDDFIAKYPECMMGSMVSHGPSHQPTPSRLRF